MIQIFAEGNEIKFHQDIIKHLDKQSPGLRFEKLGGYSMIASATFINAAKEMSDKGGTNLVILDADESVENRRDYVEKVKLLHNVDFDYFLLPDDQTPGCCETLLLEIIRDSFADLFLCFDQYTSCISANPSYVNTSLKDRFFAFAAATNQKTHLEKIDFTNNSFYNLNHDRLRPLKTFFETRLGHVLD